MSNDDWKTLRVPPDAWEKAKTQKEAAGRTWGDQIVRDEDGDEPDLRELIDRVPERTADRVLSELEEQTTLVQTDGAGNSRSQDTDTDQ